MRNHVGLILATLLSGALAVSCKKTDRYTQTESNTPPNSALNPYTIQSGASSPHLIFEETVEGDKPFSQAHSWEVGDWDYALNFVTDPHYQGQKAVRFEIRDDQPLVHDGKRAEICIVKGSEGDIDRNTWYSFAIFFPSDYDYDNEPEVLNQWYQNGSPATSLRGLKDRVVLISGNTMDNRKTHDVGPIVKNAWTEYVFHFIHSFGPDGLIEVWRNGEQILTLHGGNMYDDVMPKWKIGLYKSAFKYGTSSVHKRVAYFDNVRVGDSLATFRDMTSGSVTPPPPPPPADSTPPPTDTTSPPPASDILSYTLINATTNQDITTLTDGAQLNLANLKVDKISIRANCSSSVHTVQMVLSGADSRTRWDDAVPFALFGDDRAGDYYSWAPPRGSYTLTTTPYGGTKSSPGSPIGPAKTINFSITY